VTRAPAAGKASRTACARVLVRGGTDEKTGEALTTATLAERVAWCAALVQSMAARLSAGHWNPDGLESLASGRDRAGRPLPAMAWMALRRLGWGTAPPEGVTVNDRVVRMAQEQAGRALRPHPPDHPLPARPRAAPGRRDRAGGAAAHAGDAHPGCMRPPAGRPGTARGRSPPGAAAPAAPRPARPAATVTGRGSRSRWPCPPPSPQPPCCTCPPCGPLAAECWPT
jgi:hypothetical protein